MARKYAPHLREDVEESDRTVSEVTRRNIFDVLRVKKPSWCGRLNEVDFLSRCFDLTSMPSSDSRFADAAGDIHQHCIRNWDWDADWVFSDPRFNLLHCPDETFLKFLCEMIHPVVRDDSEEVDMLRGVFNEHLRADGWEIHPRTALSGRHVFAARRLLEGAGTAVAAAREAITALDADYVTQQITRMEAALSGEPDLAIGTAKEFVETIAKTILKERGIEPSRGDSFPELVRAVLKELALAPEDVPDAAKAAKSIRKLLQNLATISNMLAEMRNTHGTGHGRDAEFTSLGVRHARLAVNAAATLATFLFETHLEQCEAETEGQQ